MNKRKGLIYHTGRFHAACRACEQQLSPQNSWFENMNVARAWLETEEGNKTFADHVCDPEFAEIVEAKMARNRENFARNKAADEAKRAKRRATISDTPAPPALTRMLGGF